MKCRMIWDDCIPTMDRRPTTKKDIENDIHVKEYESEEELLNELLDLIGYDEEDLDLDEEASTISKIEEVLGYFNDPGDGSPNILYVSVDGKEVDGTLPYDGMDELDLETCSEQEVIDCLLADYEDVEDW